MLDAALYWREAGTATYWLIFRLLINIFKLYEKDFVSLLQPIVVNDYKSNYLEIVYFSCKTSEIIHK